MTVVFLLTSRQEPRSEIDYSFFRQQVTAGNVVEVEFRDQRVLGTFKDPPLAPAAEDAAAGDTDVTEPADAADDGSQGSSWSR